MGTIRYDTPYWHLAIYMALIGLGLGMTMQNLVLAVQNTVDTHELGAASSVVAFFRSLGGAVGVSVLGAVLGHRVKDYIADGLTALGIPASGRAAAACCRTCTACRARSAPWWRAPTATAPGTSSWPPPRSG